MTVADFDTNRNTCSIEQGIQFSKDICDADVERLWICSLLSLRLLYQYQKSMGASIWGGSKKKIREHVFLSDHGQVV